MTMHVMTTQRNVGVQMRAATISRKTSTHSSTDSQLANFSQFTGCETNDVVSFYSYIEQPAEQNAPKFDLQLFLQNSVMQN